MRLFLLLCVLFLLSAFALWQFQYGSNEHYDLFYQEQQYKPHQQISTYETNPLFQEINQRYTSLQSFEADVLLVIKKERQVKIRGKIALQKPKHFRLELSSILGKELDVGSNDINFWYWSNRDKEQGLHYAPHTESLKTGLRTPFNPKWLMNSIGANAIDTKNATVDIYNGYYRVTHADKDINGRDVIVCLLIDQQKKIVMGRYLYNQAQQLIASSETKEIQYVDGYPAPKVLTMVWQEEHVYLNWYFSSPRLNKPINPDKWLMPDYNPKINISH